MKITDAINKIDKITNDKTDKEALLNFKSIISNVKEASNEIKEKIDKTNNLINNKKEEKKQILNIENKIEKEVFKDLINSIKNISIKPQVKVNNNTKVEPTIKQKPSWFKNFDIKSFFSFAKQNPLTVDVINKNPDNAVAVKLTDGKVFYKAFAEFYASGGGGTKKILDRSGNIINPSTLEGQEAFLSSSPTIYNITLTLADTEYSQVLPNNTKRFTFQARGENDIRFAFETGKVSTPTAPYFTLKSGQNYFEDSLNLDTKTIYLASSAAGEIVEILVWT